MEDKNIKLLLVEDEISLRGLYESAFQVMGYRIDTAIDGQDAVEKLEHMEKLPALILLDIMMPKMNGYDVMNYLKNNSKFKDMLIVILSNINDKEAFDKAMKQGASSYIVKTECSPREVVEKVEEILKSRSDQKNSRDKENRT